MTARCACFLALGLVFASPLAAEPRRFDAEAFSKLVRVSDPQVSPDGKSILVVVSRPNLAKNRWENELVKVEAASGAQTVLTKAYPDLTHPRWSPTGDRIAFLSAPAAVQIFLLPAAGGTAQRISGARRGVLHFAWRPDGKSLAFATPDEPGPQTPDGRELAIQVEDEDYLATTAAKPIHAWLQSVRGGEAQRLTSGEWSLAHELPPGPPSALAWSPDGRRLALVQKRGQRRDEPGRRVALLDLESRDLRSLTPEDAVVARPVFSPDGASLAFLRRGGAAGCSAPVLASLGEGSPPPAPEAPDRCFHHVRWEGRDGDLVAGCNDALRGALWRLRREEPPARIPLGELSVAGASWLDFHTHPKAGIAFIASGPQLPPELYLLAPGAATPRKLTKFHASFAALALGPVEAVEWQCDGRRLDGVLTLPPGAEPGIEYPLVLDIHGGPQACSQTTFRARAQWLAARGWAVFEPNYRGSDSGNADLLRAIEGDPATGPMRDILSGLEAVLQGGRLDRNRVALSGFSYGGYLAGWIAASETPYRWQSLVLAAAPADLAEQLALSDAKSARRQLLPGSPAGLSLVERAGQIRARTLLLANTADVRVPVTHSYQLFHALRRSGVEVEFIVHPVAGHGPPDPARSVDLNRRWVEWISR